MLCHFDLPYHHSNHSYCHFDERRNLLVCSIKHDPDFSFRRNDNLGSYYKEHIKTAYARTSLFKNRHFGLNAEIRASFFLRLHFLISFSRAMACST